MKAINHKELKETIKVCYETRTPLFIWGTMGIGKSDTLKDIAKEMDINLIDVRVSQLEPSDLRGLPKIDNGNENTTRWLVPNWLPRDENSKGILFFDELNLSPPSIQASCYQLILDRKIGDYKLPDGWVVISAGNRVEDKANVFEMSYPLANRFTHIELQIPTIESWVDWGLKNGIDSRILTFLNFKPSRLFSFDSKIKDKAFGTPRSWYFCSKLIKDVTDLDKLEILISSAVGEGTAIELLAFLKLNRKIDVAEILKNPKKVREFKEIDLKYSLLSTMVEHYRKHKDKDTLQKIMGVCFELEAEFSVLLLRMIKAIDEAFFSKEIVKLKEFNKVRENYAQYII